ncbi:MAG: phosphoribosyltransferase family protein [Acidimicrobiia bacterium]
MRFVDRADAGRRLAAQLSYLRDEPVVVLGLPRGGVPVAYEIATALGAPLDVVVVRKLGVPFQPELGMGAIGEDGARVVNPEVVRMAGVTERQIAEVEARERAELERRARRFRGDRPRVPLTGRTAVVVDDGIAPGSTARAACEVARAHGATRVVLAVPVAPPGWTDRLGDAADEYVCLATPEPFYAIGQFYEDFSQTPDHEVVALLERAARARAAAAPSPAGGTGAPAEAGTATGTPAAGGSGGGSIGDGGRDEDVVVHAGPVRLGGRLTLPAGARGVVVFAHGSGSSRHSPRNRYVASVLVRAGLGTLLFDLLTAAEEHHRANVFDIELLARRLVDATHWLRSRPDAAGLPVGYFGASTGAAAALWAAAEPDVDVAAVVSRGGRPDLAGPRLAEVTAPTLLIVGADDRAVLDLNRRAQAELRRCPNHLTVVPRAGHLFEEPGALETVAVAARDWFLRHLPRPAAS